MTPDRTPEISVVVPSHDRPLRLRWLLNALERQTLPRHRWELVVAHDSRGPETDELLREHPLAQDGTLRHVRQAPGSAPPGRNRNAAWRATRAPVIAFTDDDCRPPEDWLRRALDAATAHPGAIVQGMTLSDPDERHIRHAPHWHSQYILPPKPWAQTCNIVYPRALLERLGGFDETLYTGEDTDLALRARAVGTPYVGAPEALTYHAVVEQSAVRRLRSLWRWKDLPELVRRHPELRAEFPLWIFWKRTHVWLPFAVLGAVLGRRNLAWTALAAPWLAHTAPQHGTDPRSRLRSASELPMRLAVDGTEMAALGWGSLRHRTLFL